MFSDVSQEDLPNPYSSKVGFSMFSLDLIGDVHSLEDYECSHGISETESTNAQVIVLNKRKKQSQAHSMTWAFQGRSIDLEDTVTKAYI